MKWIVLILLAVCLVGCQEKGPFGKERWQVGIFDPDGFGPPDDPASIYIRGL